MAKRERWYPKACKDCGAKPSTGVHISTRGLCTDCAIKRQEVACRSMQDPTSEQYKRWRAAMLDHARRVVSEAK